MKSYLILILTMPATIGVFTLACDDDALKEKKWECVIAETKPDFSTQIGCLDDYKKLSSEPMTDEIPGVRSVKTVIDRFNDNRLTFQNSIKYPIHFEFVRDHIPGKTALQQSEFNSEYFSSDRQFILGALTYFEGPNVWAYEISPYDTADPKMIETAFALIKNNTYVGDKLYFHPTSTRIEKLTKDLPDSIPIITNAEIFKGINYQPLNLGSSMGKLRFFKASELDTEYLSFRDIVVLDKVPNDISVCMGIITEEFQTPLAHINVLSQNRGTPNMGLRDAFNMTLLRDLNEQWVELKVEAGKYTVTAVTKKQADAWWDKHKPTPVDVSLDVTVTELIDIENVLDLNENSDIDDLGPALAKAIPAFGGKAGHYAAFPHMKKLLDDQDFTPFNYPKAFAIPVYFYRQFMTENGFDTRLETLFANSNFINNPAVRDAKLKKLREDMKKSPVNSDFEKLVKDKLQDEYPNLRMRFRSSTNVEDLDGFNGAGLYTSRSGELGNPDYPVLDTIKKVWSSLWYFRAYEERAYRSIDQLNIGMALLVHHSFPNEEANGVAITSNIYDRKGLEPGYFINVQFGDTSVVLPDSDVTSDLLILNYGISGKPINYLTNSSLVLEGEHVLTRAQVLELGRALTVIHKFFSKIYGPWTPDHFYGMDVEFKFDDDDWGGPLDSNLYIKQARPYPGWAADSGGK